MTNKITLDKKTFKKLLSNHLAHTGFDGNILAHIYFKGKGNSLIVCSTNGMELLKTTLYLEEDNLDFEGVYDGSVLSKVKIQKSIVKKDVVELEFTEKEMIIYDLFNQFTYKIQAVSQPFPKFEQLFKTKKNKAVIRLNALYLAKVKDLFMDDRCFHIDVEFDYKNTETSAVFISSKNNEHTILNEMLIMPIQQN